MKKHLPTSTGAMLLVTLLLCLTLIVFSVLTLSSAQSDWVLSQKYADTVASWYQG